ncbi:MAG TPA: hypothetical protein PKC14_03885 [Candidatus Absconditabacterales bacterium]|nr:hypothetical protein [Candidatus Absconditabacterales bacterium]
MTFTPKKPQIRKKGSRTDAVVFRMVKSKEKPTSLYPIGEAIHGLIKIIGLDNIKKFDTPDNQNT